MIVKLTVFFLSFQGGYKRRQGPGGERPSRQDRQALLQRRAGQPRHGPAGRGSLVPFPPFLALLLFLYRIHILYQFFGCVTESLRIRCRQRHLDIRSNDR